MSRSRLAHLRREIQQLKASGSVNGKDLERLADRLGRKSFGGNDWIKTDVPYGASSLIKIPKTGKVPFLLAQKILSLLEEDIDAMEQSET